MIESNLTEDVRLSIKLIVVFVVVSISVGRVNFPTNVVSCDTSKVPCISILLFKVVLSSVITKLFPSVLTIVVPLPNVKLFPLIVKLLPITVSPLIAASPAIVASPVVVRIPSTVVVPATNKRVSALVFTIEPPLSKFIKPPILTLSVVFIVPSICKLASGLSVPIPTNPLLLLLSIIMRSVPSV